MAQLNSPLPEAPPPVAEPVAASRTVASSGIHLSGEIKEEGIFTSLVQSFRDVFFPAKLPPLVLDSKPIYVADPMASAKMSPRAIAGSFAFYALLILLIAFLIAKHVQLTAPVPKNITALTAPIPPPVALKADRMGGGGGQHDLAPVTQGHLPKFADKQIVPPKAPPTIPPKLAVEPTVVVQKDLKMNNNLPNIGAPNSTLAGLSMGNGTGSGIGSGNGNGVGPGSGGNIGDGVNHIGGSVHAPVLTYSVDPEFSEEARKAKFSGDVQVYLIVNEQGLPTHVRVVRGVGMGLDEKAVEAVRQYKFKPALKDGKPVKVDLYVSVNFQIF